MLFCCCKTRVLIFSVYLCWVVSKTWIILRMTSKIGCNTEGLFGNKRMVDAYIHQALRYQILEDPSKFVTVGKSPYSVDEN